MERTNPLISLLIVAACALFLIIRLAESEQNHHALRDLWRRFYSLALPAKLVALSFAATLIVYGSTKPSAPRGSSPPPAVSDITREEDVRPSSQPMEGGQQPAAPRLTTNQYLANFALVRVHTNVVPWPPVPSNAVSYAPWTRYGVAEDTFWLPATNWTFIFGTNAVEGLHVSSSGTLSFDWPKGSPRARTMPDDSQLDFLAPLQTSLGLVPPQGRFWHAPTPSNTLLLTWQDVYVNRETNYPISFQSELFAGGDFTFRYDLSRLSTPDARLSGTNFVVGAQNNGGGETYAFGDTNCLVNGLELHWRAFGVLDHDIDDHDNDGLSTYDEIMIYGSDPRLKDTDLDGITDGAEVTAGTNPVLRDTDGDGLIDGSDPDPLTPTSLEDADGDGIPDAYEIWRFGGTNVINDAYADFNANGFSTLADMLAGTDPAFAACAVSASGGHHAFTWTDLPNATGYTLAVVSNGITVWSRTTNACALILTNTFLNGTHTLTVTPNGVTPPRAASISFATPAAPNLTAWTITDPFAIDPSGGCTSLLERTFAINRTGGWQQYFISSSPHAAAPWSLQGMRLDWTDSGGASGSTETSPVGDSLRLILSTNSPQTLTVRLMATDTHALARNTQPLYLLGWSPAIELIAGHGAALATTTNGPVLVAITDLSRNKTTASFTVGRQGRPHHVPPDATELVGQSLPFGASGVPLFEGNYGLSGELTGGTLLAGPSGVLSLPGSGITTSVSQRVVRDDTSVRSLSGSGNGTPPGSGGGASQPGSPIPPAGQIALFTPVVTQIRREGCPHDGHDGYPFDTACLRAAFYNAQGFNESVGLSVSLGDKTLDALLTVTINDSEGREYFWQSSGEALAHIAVTLSALSVWERDVEREPGYSYDCAYFWGIACGGCGDCASGDCDEIEGDGLGSVRFRVPLGFIGQQQFAGFVWFELESPQAITPDLFRADVAPDVELTWGNPGGTLSCARCDAAGGRTIALTPVSGGVRLSVSNGGAPTEASIWTVTRSGNAITFMRQDAATNVLRHVTYATTGTTWTCTDHLTGASATLETEAYPPENKGARGNKGDEWDTQEKLEERRILANGQTLTGTRIRRTLIGAGETAAWRETIREEWDGVAQIWRISWMTYWQDNLNPLVNGMPQTRVAADGSWEKRTYGARGREILRREALDGSAYWSDTYIATASAYQPLPGDPADWRDSRKPRTLSRYTMRGGVSNLISREWRVYSRSAIDGWPSLTLLTVRAASASATFGDAANARATFTSVVNDDDTVPVLMRGRPLRQEQADGTLRTWSYQYQDNGAVLETTARVGTVALPQGLPGVSVYTVEQSDAVFGRLLRRETRLHTTGDDPVLDWEERTYDAQGRLIDTLFSDGTASYNDWGCCRLERTRGRDGTWQEFWAIPGFDQWSAVAESSLADLPGANGRYPVSERFTDALGRQTNAVRCVWYNGSRDPATAPLATRTAYPYGTDNFRVTTDPLGVETVSQSSIATRSGKPCLIDETVSGGVTNRSLRFHGGDSIRETYWDGKWTRETRVTAYNADGCRVDSVIAEASDCVGPLTNTVTVYDFLGRVVSVGTPLGVTSNFYDGASSRRLRLTRSGSPDTLTVYDALGNQFATVMDIDGDGQVGYAGNDRISATETHYEKLGGDWWRVTTQSVWHEAGTDTCLTTGVSRVRLTGMGDWDYDHGGSLVSQRETLDTRGNVTRSSTYVDAAQAMAIQVTETPDSVLPAATHAIAGHTVWQASATAVTNAFAYDVFARQTAMIDGRSNTARTHYNALGQVDYVENAAGNRTSYGYDDLGRRVSVTDALGNTVHTAYDSVGNAASVWGATYPVEYGYDTKGRMVSMQTFRNEAGPGDETRWLYDQATGLLTNKLYADGLGPNDTYTSDGKLARRTWARGVATSYAYDAAGSLTDITYSDDTPDVAFTYDRLGRQKEAQTFLSAHRYAYDPATLALVSETIIDFQTATTNILTRARDTLGRSSGLTLGADYSVGYSYSSYGRFAAITGVANAYALTNHYGYLSGSDLLVGWSNEMVTVTRGYEPNRDLLDYVLNMAGTNLVSQFDYHNDAIGQRTRRLDLLTGHAIPVTNDFGYNPRSELTDAFMGTNTYGYAFDLIGNRERERLNLTTNYYAANELNQYASVSNGVKWTPEYDLDGNILKLRDWTLQWDGENRLVSASNGTEVIRYSHDYMGRRVRREAAGVTNRFDYDGWSLIQDCREDGGSVVTNCYFYGPDLSGTLQGAGTIGGLWARIGEGGVLGYTYDGNGNVTELVDVTGSVCGHYEYTPFGGLTAMTGDLAASNSFRFSTKRQDESTGLLGYGYRDLDTVWGRWASRDPIEEQGGANLHGFVFNDPLGRWDWIGLYSHAHCCSLKQLKDIEAAEDMAKTGIREALDILGMIDSALRNTETLQNMQAMKPIYNFETSIAPLSSSDVQEIKLFISALMLNTYAMSEMLANNNYGVECESSCSEYQGEPTYAYVRKGLVRIGLDDDLHFCPAYFEQDDKMSAKLFLHEISHWPDCVNSYDHYASYSDWHVLPWDAAYLQELAVHPQAAIKAVLRMNWKNEK